MIMVNKFMDGLPQRTFSEHNHPFQAGLLDRSDKSLGVGIQIRRARRQFHGFDPTCLNGFQKLCGEQRVEIVDQVSLPEQEAFRSIAEIPCHLAHPKPIALARDSGDLNPSTRTSIKKSTRNLVKPLRVQASIVKKSAATITSRCCDKKSFHLVFSSRSGAGSSPCCFTMLESCRALHHPGWPTLLGFSGNPNPDSPWPSGPPVLESSLGCAAGQGDAACCHHTSWRSAYGAMPAAFPALTIVVTS